MNQNENTSTPANEDLINPMVMDTEESLNEKRRIWNEVFLRCPDLADFIVDLYKNHGESVTSTIPNILIAVSKIMTEEDDNNTSDVYLKILESVDNSDFAKLMDKIDTDCEPRHDSSLD